MKPTEDDEWQLEPDDRQSVEQERSYDAANIAQSGTNGHSQVPTDRRTIHFKVTVWSYT